MEINTHHRVAVRERSQVSAARLQLRDLAHAAGFSEADEYRAGIVVTELATNLVKHATAGGDILMRAIGRGRHAQVELLSLDQGPGIGDIGEALRDGISSGGSPGTGLGAIVRLSEVFDIHSSGAGTAILARVAAARELPVSSGFEVGGVSIPVNGETVCGDLWLAIPSGGRLLLVVSDGLGHGPWAHEASLAVLDAVDATSEPRQMIERMHRAVGHTRGAAVAVVSAGRGADVVTFAGIGNISGMVRTSQSRHQMVSINGTLGHQAHTFRQFTYPWSSSALMVVFSDGLTSRWDLDKYPGLSSRHPALIAGVLCRDFSRQRDDVTVVVARETA